MITVLCGGVGAARFLAGLVQEIEPAEITAVVNVADDTTVHGLYISPDIDSCIYTLGGANDTERGWGMRGETWLAMEQLQRCAEANGVRLGDASGWFNLGDRDLGTHLYRTSRLADGLSLGEVTAELAAAWGIEVTVLPVSNDPLRTRVRCTDGRELGFQEYFVRERHDVDVASVRVHGMERSVATPGVIEAITDAEVVVIAPSNPVVSIDPVLGVPGVREAVTERRDKTIAISPIVGGVALKGPADRLLRDLGHEPTVAGIARWYAGIAATLVIDTDDADDADSVRAENMACVVTDTVMHSATVAGDLAGTTLRTVRGD